MAAHTVVSIAVVPFQRCIGGLLTRNMHGERSIRRLANSAGFSRLRAGSRRATGIPPTKSGGGGSLCLGVVQHGPGLPTNVFLNRISRVLAGGGYCRLWGVSRFWRKWPGTTVESAHFRTHFGSCQCPSELLLFFRKGRGQDRARNILNAAHS